MIIVAFDPGGTIGWAMYTPSALNEIKGGQIADDEYHLKLWSFLNTLKPNIIIYEQFTYRRGKESADLTARDCIGIMKLYRGLHEDSCILLSQPVVFGKNKSSFWTDDNLRKIGLYNVGKPHQNDATRHMLYYITDHLKEKWPYDLLR